MLTNLNEASAIPKHIKMIIINDSETLVTHKNNILLIYFHSYLLQQNVKNFGRNLED